MVTVRIEGVPIPLMRPRFCHRGKFMSVYDPQIKEKEQVRWQIRDEYREPPLTTPLRIEMLFALPIPKQTSKVRIRNMLSGEMPHMCKPDLDNLVKFILDCLNGILFDDDRQISEFGARKIYSDHPRTIVQCFKYDQSIDRNFRIMQEIKKNEGHS